MGRTENSRREPLFIYVYGPGFSVVGRTVGLGGTLISYECMEPGKDHPHQVHVDIFSSEVGFHVQRLPCLLISASRTYTGGKFNTVAMRRYDLEVVPVRSAHRAALADLVAHAHLWDLGQGAHEPQAFQSPARESLHVPNAQLETFTEWLGVHNSE